MTTKKNSPKQIPQAINATPDMENVIKETVRPLVEELSKITTKVDSLQNKADNLTTNVYQLQSNVNDVEGKVEDIKKAYQGSDQKPKPTKMESYIQFFTVLTLAVGIILTFTNIFKSGPENNKTIAETEQINTETLKTRVELQQMLDQLETNRSKGVDEYNKQLNEMLPQLQTTITKLNELNDTNSKDVVVENLYKSLLIGIFGTAVFFFLRTFSILWSWLTSSLRNIFYALRPNWKEEKKLQKYEQTQKFINLIDPVLMHVPSLVFLIVEIYIFTSLSIPLFDSVSASLGSNVRFSPVLSKLWGLDLRSAVEMLRAALFSQ
jgi:hypothetical protein